MTNKLAASSALGVGEQFDRAAPWMPRLLGALLSGTVLLAVLVACHWHILSLPPYEDQAVGLWNEADFLVESGFDYYRLRYVENHYMDAESGPRSYMISVLPTVVALLMKYSPSIAAAITVAHLLTLACTSAIAVLLYQIARPWSGPRGAALLALAWLTTPLVYAQEQMVGMEIPLTLAALATAHAVWRERFVAAAGLAMVAFLMKATGMLLTFSTLGYLSVLLIVAGTSTPGTHDRRYLAGWLANLSALMCQVLLVRVGDTTVALRRQINWPDALMLPHALDWCPDLVLLLVVALLLTIVVWIRPPGPKIEQTKDYWRSRRQQLADCLRGQADLIYCWLVVLGMIAASSQYIFIPRYFTCATPFLLLALAIVLFGRLQAKKTGLAAFALLALVNVANRNGDFFPSIEQAGRESFRQYAWLHARSCPFTERSGEYLLDQLSQIEIMRKLDREFHDHPVLIGQPQRLFLMKPRLGYVSAPLTTYDAARPAEIARALDEWRRSGQPEHDPIYFWFGPTRATLPLPGPRDDVLYFDGQSTPILVYRKRP